VPVEYGEKYFFASLKSLRKKSDPELDPDPDPDPLVRGTESDPDPRQQVTDPRHWSVN
jgi:hypothetical protein